MFSAKIARFSLVSLVSVALLASTQAHAVQRTHVSAAFGSDANTATNCTAAAPCRFFQAAMTVTDNNGEVIVLDSGGYGAVTITKSLALIAPTGVYAGISVFPGADGVTIATPGVSVVLRGITINSQGGRSGINMTAGSRLTVENCVVANFVGTTANAGNGIVVNTPATVRVIDTTIRDNNNFGLLLQNGAKGTITRAVFSGNNIGISALGNSATDNTTAHISDTTVDGTNGGFTGVTTFSSAASSNAKVSIRNSHIINHAGFGLSANSSGGGVVSLAASNNMLTGNATAIRGAGSATIIATGNTVTDSNIGFQGGALFQSAGNNTMSNNANDILGSVTVVSTK
jgi:hypothetical protein